MARQAHANSAPLVTLPTRQHTRQLAMCAGHGALVSPAHDQRNTQFCECAGVPMGAQPAHWALLCALMQQVQGQKGKRTMHLNT